MIICICHRVSDRDIARATREGCASFAELQAQTKAATGCGRCRDCAHDSFHAQRLAVLGAHAGLSAPPRAAQPALACA